MNPSVRGWDQILSPFLCQHPAFLLTLGCILAEMSEWLSMRMYAPFSIALRGWNRQLDHLGATKSCLTTLPWHTQLFFPGPGSDLFHSEHIYTCSLALRLPESQPTWGWAHQILKHPTHFDDSFMEPRTKEIKSQKSLCPDPCLQDAVFLNYPR